jgi:predicted transcriptional regulator
MSEGQIDYYLSGSDEGWAVRIKKLTMYEPPRNLSAIGISNAPKSWLYIEEKQIKIKKRKTD